MRNIDRLRLIQVDSKQIEALSSYKKTLATITEDDSIRSHLG